MTKVLRYPLIHLGFFSDAALGYYIRVNHIVGGAIGLSLIMAMFSVAAGLEDFAIKVFS